MTPVLDEVTKSVTYPRIGENTRVQKLNSDMSVTSHAVQRATTPPDPFDPASLRLSVSVGSADSVNSKLTTVPVRKPAQEWFFRCHPEEAYQLTVLMLELKEEQEFYLVHPSLQAELEGETLVSPRQIVTAINRQGVLFLWPLRLPRSDGRLDNWSQSAMDASNQSKNHWVRMQAKMSAGAYSIVQAIGDLGAPDWPVIPFNELLQVAFTGRYISSPDHRVLRQLRGEI